MKKLTMTFQMSNGKQTSLKPAVAKDDLAADDVKKAMGEICTLDIFKKNGIELYRAPKSAHYTETIVTEIF
ncbi:hypothetical protein CBF34_02770 [Vagococcus penaei]|uniref:Uncharacterized protein n=1 Tax=Vagococcus penaei TaxID=633807 RepID=A0A1Q2D455_9ENTE|nr:DUF2922 domain-containing protein [Vagococcus penaei]AQP53085.1 hypothetical protein BW732_01815 [Vagococcus penaei]RSU06052.1 hypothetical protein CBF34_02770 [Vagococcus penaei]